MERKQMKLSPEQRDYLYKHQSMRWLWIASPLVFLTLLATSGYYFLETTSGYYPERLKNICYYWFVMYVFVEWWGLAIGEIMVLEWSVLEWFLKLPSTEEERKRREKTKGVFAHSFFNSIPPLAKKQKIIYYTFVTFDVISDIALYILLVVMGLMNLALFHGMAIILQKFLRAKMAKLAKDHLVKLKFEYALK